MFVCFSFTSSLGVGYLMVCTANYPNVLAFCFLDELQKEFIVTYDTKRISSAVRPYSFIEFGELHGVLQHVSTIVVNFDLSAGESKGKGVFFHEKTGKRSIAEQEYVPIFPTKLASFEAIRLVSIRAVQSLN